MLSFLSETIRIGAKLDYSSESLMVQHNRSLPMLAPSTTKRTEDSPDVGEFMVSNLSWKKEEATPTALRVGSSKILTYLPLRSILMQNTGTQEDWLIAIGGEVLIHPQFRLRLGINTRRFDLQTRQSR